MKPDPEGSGRPDARADAPEFRVALTALDAGATNERMKIQTKVKAGYIGETEKNLGRRGR